MKKKLELSYFYKSRVVSFVTLNLFLPAIIVVDD